MAAENGLSNEAYDGDTKKPLESISAAVANVAPPNTTSTQPNRDGRSTNMTVMEEIELQPKEKYQPLCQCEENGLSCRCKSILQRRIMWESWNKCKTVSIAFLVLLVCVWFIVYVTLSQLKTL